MKALKPLYLDDEPPAEASKPLITWAKAWAVLKRLLIGLAVAVFIVFVWPTPYRYGHSKGYLLRINRFTGDADVVGTR